MMVSTSGMGSWNMFGGKCYAAVDDDDPIAVETNNRRVHCLGLGLIIIIREYSRSLPCAFKREKTIPEVVNKP